MPPLLVAGGLNGGNLSQAMTGDELSKAIESSNNHTASPIITDLLYPSSVFMLTGEAGKGKSVVATQLALSLTSSASLFGSLTIPQPKRVYYLQLEGHPPDYFRRIRYMLESLRPDFSRLYWDSDKRFDAMQAKSVASKLKQISERFPNPDVIILDPIYKAVSGDLSRADIALGLIRFSDLITDTFSGSTIIFIHHPHRTKHDAYGKPIQEDDAYYGHSFIKNHIDTAYGFSQVSNDGQISRLRRTKLREERTLPEITLRYHPETYTCSMEERPTQQTKREQAEIFLASLAQDGKQTDFYEVRRSCEVSTQFLRELQQEWQKEGRLELIKKPGHTSIWIPKVPPTRNILKPSAFLDEVDDPSDTE